MTTTMTAGVCRVCGCTDDDCSGCVERTGEPCYWVKSDLCSACAGVAYLDDAALAATWCSLTDAVIDPAWLAQPADATDAAAARATAAAEAEIERRGLMGLVRAMYETRRADVRRRVVGARAN
jgi:hypothetical protein